jgi:hypothetical protein
MADIKTMTQEITELNIDLENSIVGGEYDKLVVILNKIIEKLDEIVTEVNS